MFISSFNIQKEQHGVKKYAGIDGCVAKRKNKARKMRVQTLAGTVVKSMIFLGNVCILFSWEIDQD